MAKSDEMSRHCRSWSEADETVSAAGLRRRELGGVRLRLARIEVPAGTRAPRHSHSYEQFVQVLSGTGTVETDQGRLRFGPGSVLHFPPETEHMAEFETETVLVETNLPG